MPDNREQLTFRWDFAAEGRAASPLLGGSAACKDGDTGLGLFPCRGVPFSQLAGCSADCHRRKVSADGGWSWWPIRPPLPAHRSWWGLPFPGICSFPSHREQLAPLQGYESNRNYSCGLSCRKSSGGQNADCSCAISSLTCSHTESYLLGRHWRAEEMDGEKGWSVTPPREGITLMREM